MMFVIVHGAKAEPYEYFCKVCWHLCLSFVMSDKCANCGSTDIIKGKVGSLDKDKLYKLYGKKIL